MTTSRVGRRGRTTIPRAVLEALAIRVGDELTYSIEGDRVVLASRSSAMVTDPFALFTEWDSDADRLAYTEL